MKQFALLLRLVFKEKKRLILSLGSTVLVALFTFIFVNLVQPIMDHMFNMSPGGIPEKARFTDLILGLFDISMEQLVTYLPWILVVVIFCKGLFTFFSSFI